MSNTINLLALDSSTDACSVAVFANGKVEERFEQLSRSHSRLLLPMIDSLLKELGISIADITAFAFGRGPGSFTGIRIACSVIQALGYGLSKPIIPVSTLRAMAEGAYQALRHTRVCAKLDARLQETYWGLYTLGIDGIMEASGEEHLSSTEEIVFPTGDWVTTTELPHAKDIARIAVIEYQRGVGLPAEAVFPIYLREEVVKKTSS